jgi:hypothetical protein
MTAFRKPLAISCVGAFALAALNLRANSEIRPDLSSAERVVTAGCRGRAAECMVEINFAYPARDLSVVPPDVYF